ncbi:hypothetical protein M7I_2628 [Glarea lozoyensis 74030]|uniref:Uncharacterized protein n=1 Tax=Glarea lozoyensis (strain ATCC 74030 / MF5533) TaxID=1104152 RepID=H0EJ90_GLAL7|nr:hypothetical protein M7I_2628 [Glarea lozoyensis 74030]
MDKNSRITFQLDSPYNQTAWPEVAAGDQDTILELLCRRLEEQISKSKDDELQGKPSSVLQNSSYLSCRPKRQLVA